MTEPTEIELAPSADITHRLATAEEQLEALTTAEDAKILADYAGAVRELAKRARLGPATVNYSLAIRLLAECRMAGFVDQGQEVGQIATPGGDRTKPRDPGVAILEELDINDRRLAEARRLARDYTEDEIRELAQAATADGKFLARDRLLRSDAQRMQASDSDEWSTPAEWIDRVRRVLGGIDLDPASTASANETVKAARFFTVEEDGLYQEWKGRVFLNPPYGGKAGKFIAKLVECYQEREVPAAICLVSAHSPETDWFRPLWDEILCFTYGRIAFGDSDAPTHGSVFGYLGPDWEGFAEVFGDHGAVVARWPQRPRGAA